MARPEDRWTVAVAAVAGAMVAVGCMASDRVRPEPPEERPAPVGARAKAPVAPPSAVAPAASGQQPAPASAEPAASSAPALRPDGCPAPPSDLPFPVDLAGPLGPARVDVSAAAPRCYPSTLEFGRYMNARFALAVDVPRFLKAYGTESGNGDGATFELGPEMTLRAWGGHNHAMAAGLSEAQTRAEACTQARVVRPGERLLSAACEGKAVLRVSVAGGRRTLEKTIYEDGLLAAVQLDYDESLSAYFEPLERRVRDSLRTTSGGMYDRPRKPNHRYPRD